jgi:riboflavin transporter FmnP
MATVKSGWKSLKDVYFPFVMRYPEVFILETPFFIARGEGEKTIMTTMQTTKSRASVKTIARIGILSALAFVLMMFEFPLPFAPSFYKLDFSEVAVLLGTFAMGPVEGVIIEALKIVLNLIFTGSQTAYVGEFANFLIGCAFIIPAGIIYKRHKTKKTALIGMLTGTLCMALAGALMNYYVLLPLYSTLYGLPMETIIGMGTAIIPAVKTEFQFVCLCVVPFNLFKGVVVSAITFILYKHVSPILHR